jgi:AGCS family alanine or glycine:cation symporter
LKQLILSMFLSFAAVVINNFKKGEKIFMEAFENFISFMNSIVWGPPMLILLVGTHVFLTIRLGFIQKYIFKAIKLSITKDPDAEGDVSQFAALQTAMSATLGTGNLVGVATAVVLGGPGAIFWLWLTGFFGIATKYGEGLLAVKYRVKTSDGLMLGGPMYALERGLNLKWAGIAFALFAAIASFGIGNMVQANSIAANFQGTLGIPPIATGLLLAGLTFAVIVGGIKSIAAVAEKTIPTMALIFFIGNIIIICLNYQYVGPAIGMIVTHAFTPLAAGGGFAGATVLMAMRFGVARGLFSNESGLGSAPIAAAAAVTRNPVRQAMVSMTGTFWDTIILCACTGIMYTSSVLRYPEIFAELNPAQFAAQAFSVLPFGQYFFVLALFAFAFTTILGWEYYGERCVEYLSGKKGLMPYRIVYSIVVFVGATVALGLVWDIADMFNALMAIPNLISLILLSGVIVAETKKYLWDDNLDAIDTEPIMQIDN